MSDKTSFEAVSRRKALSILGLVGALGLAASASVLAESEANAQEAAPAAAGHMPGGHKRRQIHHRQHRHNATKRAAAAPAPK
jgi:hypothetical protein